MNARASTDIHKERAHIVIDFRNLKNNQHDIITKRSHKDYLMIASYVAENLFLQFLFLFFDFKMV